MLKLSEEFKIEMYEMVINNKLRYEEDGIFIKMNLANPNDLIKMNVLLSKMGTVKGNEIILDYKLFGELSRLDIATILFNIGDVEQSIRSLTFNTIINFLRENKLTTEIKVLGTYNQRSFIIIPGYEINSLTEYLEGCDYRVSKFLGNIIHKTNFIHSWKINKGGYLEFTPNVSKLEGLLDENLMVSLFMQNKFVELNNYLESKIDETFAMYL